MSLSSPSVVVAAAALWVAALQLILAHRRDLGPFTLCLVGIAAVLGLAEARARPELWAGIAATMLVASLAWARGGRLGVGRPELNGLVLGISVAACAVSVFAGPLLQQRGLIVAEGTIEIAVACSLGLLGVLAGTLSLWRPRAGLPPIRWVGEIEVEGPG